MFVFAIRLIILGAAFEDKFRELFRKLANWLDDEGEIDPASIALFFLGLYMLIWGLSSFVYFTASELFWRDKHPGRRRTRSVS